MHRFSAFWHMRLPHRLQGQKVKSHGAGAYCGGHLAAQLVCLAVLVVTFVVVLWFVNRVTRAMIHHDLTSV